MSAFSWACQQAVFTLLSGSSSITSIVGDRIYDGAPDQVSFPWLEIGDGQIITDDTSKTDGTPDEGVSDFVDLHIWSRANGADATGPIGKKQAKQIGDAIHTLFNQATLTVAGRSSALSWVRNIRYLRDPDGITVHGVVTIEIIHRT